MEPVNERSSPPSKQCQIEGCEEISVGSKVPLCRKHRNKTYKQNYKKKKKNAEANLEENTQEIVIDDQYLLEQKYSNMLQDVLTQKQMELFESPSVVSLLKNYQRQRLITRSGDKTSGCSLSSSNSGGTSENSDNCVKPRQPCEVKQARNVFQSENRLQVKQLAHGISSNCSQRFIGDWNQNHSSMSADTMLTQESSLDYPHSSSSAHQAPHATSYVSTNTTFHEAGGFQAVP